MSSHIIGNGQDPCRNPRLDPDILQGVPAGFGSCPALVSYMSQPTSESGRARGPLPPRLHMSFPLPVMWQDM